MMYIISIILRSLSGRTVNYAKVSFGELKKWQAWTSEAASYK